jgi:hypothetical protein
MIPGSPGLDGLRSFRIKITKMSEKPNRMKTSTIIRIAATIAAILVEEPIAKHARETVNGSYRI